MKTRKYIPLAVLVLFAFSLFPSSLAAGESNFSRKIYPGKKCILKYDGITLEIPAGAVDKEVNITIKKQSEVYPVNDILMNATTGTVSYRFEPTGMHFLKNLRISIPFDTALLSSNTALSNLFTYFYNEQQKNWERLPRIRIDKEKGVVVSLTDHFTDMINATLKMPESPDKIDFNINSIKSLEGANPASGVMDLKGLNPGSTGGASFQIPLDIPRGRGDATPRLAIGYNSGSPNSWMGRGFDISVPAITTDTRFGLPEYNGNDTYILDGEELVPVSSSTENTIYRLRVEKAFKQIVRHRGSGRDYWEVTDKSGKVQLFGRFNSSVNGWVGPDRKNYGKVYTWYLTKEKDANGNTVDYVYDYDAVNKYTYLKEINYSGWTDGSEIEEGKYCITFVTSDGRPDRRMDGRGKFLSKLVRRLDEVDIEYNGEIFRKYLFTYRQNEFSQTVLETFSQQDGRGGEFYSYRFGYNKLPEVTDVDGTVTGYRGYGSEAVNWSVQLSGSYPGLNSTVSYGVGASLYAGLKLETLSIKNWKFTWSTIFDIGVSGGLSVSNSLTKSTLLDINGDGLPDAVWKDGNSLRAYRNTGNGFATSYELVYSGIPGHLNESTQKGYSLGASASLFGASGSVTLQRSWMKGKSTFSDINGDGFVDYVASKDGSFYKNTGAGFIAVPYGSSSTSLSREEPVNEDDYKRVYALQEPLRKWKAFRGGVIEIRQNAAFADPFASSEDGVRAATYPENGQPYSMNLLAGYTSDTDSREFSVHEGSEIYFLMDEGVDSGGARGKQTAGDDINWDVSIRYKNINYFEGIKNASLITPSGAQEDFSAIISYGHFIPAVVPEPVFKKLLDGASAATVSGGTVIPGGKAKLLDGYRYRPEFGDFIRINNTADSTVEGLLITATTQQEREDLFYYTDFSGEKVHPEKKDGRTSFSVNAPASELTHRLYLDTILDMGLVNVPCGSQFFSGTVLLDSVKGIDGTEGFEELYLVPGGGSWTLESRKAGSVSAVDAQITDNDVSLSVSFLRDGLVHRYLLENPTTLLTAVPAEKYNGELLEDVTTGYTFTFPDYTRLQAGEYSDLLDRVNEEDASFIKTVYHRYPPVPENIEYYELSVSPGSDVWNRLILIFDSLSDDPDSVLDKPLFQADSESFGIIALNEAEYESFPDKDSVSGFFTRADDGAGNLFYLLKWNLTDNEKAVLKKAERKKIRDTVTFPYYSHADYADEYVLKNDLSAEDKDTVKAEFGSLGWSVYTLLNRSITYFEDSLLPVYYGGEASAAEVGNPVPAGTVPLPHHEPGYVVIPSFDSEGKSVLAKKFIHSYNTSRDYSSENLIVYPDTIFNQENTKGTDLAAQADETQIPESLEVFSGGVAGWYYGSWTGYYPFDKTLIHRKPPSDTDENTSALPDYFSAMKRNIRESGGSNTVEVETIGKDTLLTPDMDTMIGRVSSYTDSRFDDNGKPVNTTYSFTPLIDGSFLHADRKGGDTYDTIPRGSSPVSGGKIGQVSAGRSETTDVNGSVNLVFAGLSFSKNSGTSWQNQEIMDINGDRYPDLVSYTSEKDGSASFSVVKGSGSGFGGVEDWSGPVKHVSLSNNVTYGFGAAPGGGVGAIIQRYDDDGKTADSSVSAPDDGSGGSIGFSGFNGTAGSSSRSEGFLDINGDGLPDQVSRSGTGTYKVYVNEGGGGFSSGISFGTGIDTDFYNPLKNAGDMGNKPLGIEFSNSGSLGTGASLSWSGAGIVKGVSVSMGFNASANRTLSRLMDINGDGLADQVVKNPSEGFFRVKFNLGDRFAPAETLIYKPDWDTTFTDTAGLLAAVASQNSGVLDSIHIPFVDQSTISAPSFISNGSQNPFNSILNPLSVDDAISYSSGISINLGANVTMQWGVDLGIARFGFTLIPGINGFYAVSTTSITMQDINGDGLPDHVLKKTGDNPVKVELNTMGKAGLLHRITLPSGGSIELEYGRRGNTAAMPQSRYVLEKVTSNDGYEENSAMSGEHSYSESYNYSGGYYDRAERKFYGFGEVKTTKADGSVTSVTYENSNYYTRGLVKSTQIEDENGKIFLKKENTYESTQTGSGILTGTVCQATLLSMEESRTYDPADGDHLETATEYTYDSYGNVTHYIDRGDENNLYDDITLEIEYREPGTSYLAGLPERMEVTGRSGKLLRKREGTYDVKGNLLYLRNYYTENDSSDYTFEYDTYGNMTSVEDPLGYRKDYHYDNEVHSYVTEITVSNSSDSADSYTSSISYDYRFGVETSSTDINSNTVTKEYDTFGRLIKVRSPYDTGETPALQYTYHTDTFPWKALTRNKIIFNPEDTETMDTCIIMDGLNRILTTAKEGEVYDSGNTKYGWNKSGFIVYDSKGRAVQEGQRVFEETTDLAKVETAPVRPTVKTFDVLDRITSITLPDGSVMEKSYEIENGRYKELTTDPLGNITERFKDIRQNIVEIIKKDSSAHPLTRASYSYSVLGELLEVLDTEGNKATITYDLKGRRLSIESAETGLTEFTYDKADHLVRKVDANLRNRGKMINYLYDPLGRLEKVDYPYMKGTLYTYGSSGADNNSAGRITRIEDESGSTENTYGKLGETKTVIKRINRLTPFPETREAAFHYLFDYQGRMESITYPDGEEVKYTYNRGGEVESIKGEHNGLETTYVENTGYDEYGQRVYLRYGNGVETTWTYDENRRWLKTIHTRNSLLTLQNSSYTFDKVGNILSLQNESDRYTSDQSYTYDGLYQLVQGEGTFVDREHGYVQETNTYTQGYTYDTIGNILRKTSANTSTIGIPGSGLTYDDEYSYFSDKPKQLERAGNMYYLYDSNGNIIEERWGGHSTGGVMGSGSITKTGDVSVLDRGIGLIRETVDNEGEVYKRSYTWDEENRLKSTVDGNHNVSYRYDYSGQRTNKKDTKGNETLYFNSLWLETEDSPFFRQSKNIYLGETRIATRLNLENEPSTGYERVNTYYYHPDHLGSSTIVTDYEGEVYEHVEYTPYGEEWIEKGNDQLKKIPYRFNAKELDEETGLYYYGARYLNPKTSRWISADPAGVDLIDPAQKGFSLSGINWYAYASNNPVKYVDPAGMAEIYADDIHGNPILAWPGRDIKAEMHVEIDRNSEKVDSNDTARIKIGNQTLAEYGDVQSEKNYIVSGKQNYSQKYESDFSDPEYPNATLPEGNDYKMTLLGGTPSYDKPMQITSKTAQIPGFGKVGVKDSYGFLAHSKSKINQSISRAYSFGCQIFGDKSYKSFRSTIEGIGFKNGESVPLSILGSSSSILKGRNF